MLRVKIVHIDMVAGDIYIERKRKPGGHHVSETAHLGGQT